MFGGKCYILEIYINFNKTLKYLDLFGKFRIRKEIVGKVLEFFEFLGKFRIVLTVLDFWASFEIGKEVGISFL